MTVAQLIEHLSKLKPELEVYTAIDEEGNGYNEVWFEPTVMLAMDEGRDVSIYNLDERDWLEEEGYDISEIREVVVI